jgi:hypothetical protein
MTPAAKVEIPAVVAAPAPVVVPPVVPAAPAKPATMSALLADVEALAAKPPAPVAVPPKAAAAAPAVETPAKPAPTIPASVLSNVNEIARALNMTTPQYVRAVVDQLRAAEAGQPVQEIRSPLAPALSEVEALRAENAKLIEQITGVKTSVDDRFKLMDQQAAEARSQQRLLGAQSFISQNSAKWPYIAASDQGEMAAQLSALAELAESHPQHKHLTADQLAEMLEADVKQRASRYAPLFSSAPAATKSPQARTAPAAEATTIPPTVTPTDGKTRKRRTESERIAAASAKVPARR